MKHLYPRLLNYLTLAAVTFLIHTQTSLAQCPANNPQGSINYTKTVPIPAGNTSMTVKFPQFAPTQGMVTCMKLCITITGVVNSLQVENDNDVANNIVRFLYQRTDQLSGPGISPINNMVNMNLYGNINLTKDDQNDFSGTDYFEVYNDTVMNTVTICRTITDTASLSDFYGSDSVAYQYDIDAWVYPALGGNTKNLNVTTSGVTKFDFQYCSCPFTTLPLNVYGFEVRKMLQSKAELTWSGYDEAGREYQYEAQVSRDGRSFTTYASFAKHTSGNDPYSSVYTATGGPGIYYFRIRQVYKNGYVRFTPVKQISLDELAGPKFSVYPNPSNGIVGIKFDNNRNGQYALRIFNAQGQAVVSKDLNISGSSYSQVARLETGVYWVRITNKSSNESSVTQLLIK